ncbi:MAG: 2-oxo acid dehydrogenase subunit E2, partial [Gammaproteobacteria bacterium]|nr:2-oxo acid dehydrogenase subunit E2 [Gammaproteobacteria bacterium]
APRGRAVPAARALAKRLRVDLGGLRGSGRDGLITLDDVLSSMREPPATPAAAGTPAGGEARFQPLRGARRSMAQSMSLARDQTALSTVCDDADIDDWVDAGAYMSRLMRAMARACRAEPALNAWYDPADDSRALLPYIDLGVAVDTPEGLLVPVIRDIAGRSARELDAELAARKEAAHARTIAAADLRGFTLILSNFGTLAGRYATPQVVPPAVAILGAGKVRREPAVVAGQLAVRRRMPLSLSFDHRCVTGGEACRFLAAVIADLQEPD